MKSTVPACRCRPRMSSDRFLFRFSFLVSRSSLFIFPGLGLHPCTYLITCMHACVPTYHGCLYLSQPRLHLFSLKNEIALRYTDNDDMHRRILQRASKTLVACVCSPSLPLPWTQLVGNTRKQQGRRSASVE